LCPLRLARILFLLAIMGPLQVLQYLGWESAFCHEKG